MANKRKFSNILFIQIFLSVFFLFNSCSNLLDTKSDKGQICLNFPSRSARSAQNPDLFYYNFIITNNETKAEKVETGSASGTIQIELNAGFYNFTVQLYHPSSPEQIFYEGEAKEVEVLSGQTTNLSIKLQRIKQDWKIDLTPVIESALLDENPWGVTGITEYQSDSFDITELFNGMLPKAGDTINFIWKGKSSKSLRKLHIILADESGSGDTYKWVHLLSEETYSKPVITNINADVKFEINTTLTLSESSENNVKIFLAYGREDSNGASLLYTGDEYNAADIINPEISIVNNSDGDRCIVHFTKPGKFFLDSLKNKECDGFYIGIASGLTEEGYDKWLFGNRYYLTDENAFEDIDFSFNLIDAASKIEDNKIWAVLDFYKDVDLPEGERTWLKELKSTEYDYSYNADNIRPLTLEYSEGKVILNPGSAKYMNSLRSVCGFYYIGLASGFDERPSPKWIRSERFRPGDEGFLPSENYEIDFTSQINEDFISKVEEGKVFPVMHLYKTYDDEKQTGEWLTEILGYESEFRNPNNP